MKKMKRLLAGALAALMTVTMVPFAALATPATDSPEDANINYMRLENHTGPSGVPLGGTGVGYYEISPEGKFTRNCINNIHKSFVDSPDGMFLATWQNGQAARLQRDDDTKYGMQGYSDSYYTGLFPRMELDFENAKESGIANASFNAYSGVVAQNVKDSSLPVAWYEVELTNDSDEPQEMSAMFAWADLIGRGIKDTNNYNNANFNPDGESGDWYNMTSPDTTAEDITIGSWKGVKQSADETIIPNKMTFQNYNTDFVILAEDTDDTEISTLKSYQLGDQNALNEFVQNGEFQSSSEGKVALSSSTQQASQPTNGSAVAVSTTVDAGETKTVRFLVAWYMPEYTQEDMDQIASKAPNSDYNKYYHNFFSSIEELASYATENGERIYDGIMEWQQPILDSNMPEWLQFKEINSSCALFTNGVLNKRMNFTTLEGEMGGLGGTMDQKIASHPFYEKLFPELNVNENRQFSNVLGENGEIQHYDIHYYVGMADSDPDNKYNPTPNGSMIDNTGAWMLQLLNYYRQTGDDTDLTQYYDVMKDSMAFIQSKCEPGTNYPNYYTTYDDYTHPDILIFSGIVYLNMLDMAQEIALINGQEEDAAEYARLYDLTAADVEKLYIQDDSGLGFYSFGSDPEYIASDGQEGTIMENIMFSGAMAGQFVSRYSGFGDVIPFENFVSHMKKFITTSIQQTGDYFAPKVYDMEAQRSLDNAGSRCWPFYLDSYGGMAAIQAGYVEDGFEVLEHTQLVNLRQGYAWTQNLWNPAYSTYMTAPVVWFINDVLAGSSIDVPNNTLTLGPTTIPGTDKLVTPLYYPKYWAELVYDESTGEATYTITKTFYEEGEDPITFDTLNITPNGTASSETTVHDIDFTVEEGNVLDLSGFMDDFARNVTLGKNLTPMPKYDPNYVHYSKTADGTGLEANYYTGTEANDANLVKTEVTGEIDYEWAPGETPIGEGGENSYTATYSGSILPSYDQTYELRFVVKGDMELIFDGKKVEESEFVHSTNNGTIEVPEGCTLNVYQVNLSADQLYPIELTYTNNDASQGGLVQFMWWSTSQTPEFVPQNRMFEPLDAYESIRAVDYAGRSGNVHQTGDCMDYIENNNSLLYKSIDFGENGFQDGTITCMIGGPNNDVCQGGTVEIRKDSENGQLLGTVQVGTSSDWDDYQPYTGTISLSEPLVGKQNICLVFRSNSTFLGNLISFQFEKSAFNTYMATEYDEKSGRIVESGDGSCMEYVEDGNWLKFSALDFGENFQEGTILVEAAVEESGNCNGGTVEVRRGSPDGDLMGTVTITPTGTWSDYVQFEGRIGLEEPISGDQDIYLVFHSNLLFLGNVRSFTFTNTTGARSAYETIPATEYSIKSGRIMASGDGSCMEYVENDNWLGFTRLDFGEEGLQNGKVYADVSVLESYNCTGGTIEVYKDSPTGQPIGIITVTPTAGWDDYQRFEADLQLEEPLTGLQNIYFVCKTNLVFLGNIRSVGFEKEQPAAENGVLSVSLDRDPAQYDVNEPITMTIRTTSDVVGLSLRNEYGRNIGLLKVKSVYDPDGFKTWTVVTSLGTAGEGRTLNIWYKTKTHDFQDSGVQTVLDVVAQPEEARIISVYGNYMAKVNEPIQFTVETTPNITQLGIFNERGRSITSTVTDVKVEDGVKIWSLEITLGTAGQRVLSVQARNPGTGQWQDDHMTLPLNVTQ